MVKAFTARNQPNADALQTSILEMGSGFRFAILETVNTEIILGVLAKRASEATTFPVHSPYYLRTPKFFRRNAIVRSQDNLAASGL